MARQTVVAFFLFLTSMGYAMKTGLKKIEIVDTNNDAFFVLDTSKIHSPFDLKYLAKVRGYIESKGFKPPKAMENKLIFEALKWVASQWNHDGMNQPPRSFNALDILKSVHKNSERYRCVEYGLVLLEVLQSYGFVTRKIGLLSKNVAYGGFGQGHVAMEVWSNDLKKWIFLDPQFGTYLTENTNSKPLSFFEIYNQKKKKKWKKINAIFVIEQSTGRKVSKFEYKNFLKNYFGHITISSKKNYPRLALLLENQNPSLTFQGQISNRIIFTKDPDLLYFDLNRVSIDFKYRAKEVNFQKVAEKYKIKTDKDYIKNMVHFAASPNYTLNLKHNMPIFSHFEYRTARSEAWKSIKGNSFDWNATKKLNFIEVRAINKLGRSGPPTFFKISYK